MVNLALTLLLSFAGSFICSLCEAALYSVSDVRVAAMIHEGRPGARLLAKLRSRIDRAIAAILTINTITHTAGAAIGGAIIGETYGSTLLGVFTAAFTIVLLLGTEIVPKSLGVAKADYLAPRLAWVMEAMVILVYPIVLVCEWLTRAIVKEREVVAPTEHELVTMTRLAARHGELEPDKAKLVVSALRLDSVPVREIMTPRTVVFALPDKMPLTMIEQHSEHWTHSRLPLVKDSNPNEVVGIVHRRDVFDVLVRDEGNLQGKTLSDLKRPVRFIRDDVPADEALQKFLSGRQHMFIVLDEYGSFVGLVTLEDVMEQLLGKEIVGEHDPVTDMQELARKKDEARGPVIESEEPAGPEPEALHADDPLVQLGLADSPAETAAAVADAAEAKANDEARAEPEEMVAQTRSREATGAAALSDAQSDGREAASVIQREAEAKRA